MEFSDKGIILRVGRFKEADLWVRFLSPARGLFTAFAFGGCRSRQRFSGCLDHLNTVHFRVRMSRAGSYTSLEEGVLLRSPRRLRTDLHRLGLAVNCQKFLEAMGVSLEGAQAAYTLFEEALEALEADKGADAMLPLLFRARFAFDQGYRPETGFCLQCGCEMDSGQGAVFHVQEGLLLCGNCAAPSGPMFRLGNESLDALRFVQEYSPLHWEALSLSERARRELTRAVDGFIQFHIGLTWDKGMFRRV
ncbi:DNA repair protein RecO [Desulfovibrio psychrotolerans]|uniref:DNA repair protein RecO n=1 Tax=Desulfovibrio psychrotolerans TaxID=415242 RepID=UPI00157B5500|nr:DNA repair protein RecO [Desulfovibrio psychrotolerans]